MGEDRQGGRFARRLRERLTHRLGGYDGYFHANRPEAPEARAGIPGVACGGFGSLGKLAPSWWVSDDGEEAEGLAREPDVALDRFLEWVDRRGIEPWPHQEDALMSLMVGNHVILGTPTGSGKSLVALGLHFMALATDDARITPRPSRRSSTRSSSIWWKCSAAITSA